MDEPSSNFSVRSVICRLRVWILTEPSSFFSYWCHQCPVTSSFINRQSSALTSSMVITGTRENGVLFPSLSGQVRVPPEIILPEGLNRYRYTCPSHV